MTYTTGAVTVADCAVTYTTGAVTVFIGVVTVATCAVIVVTDALTVATSASLTQMSCEALNPISFGSDLSSMSLFLSSLSL